MKGAQAVIIGTTGKAAQTIHREGTTLSSAFPSLSTRAPDFTTIVGASWSGAGQATHETVRVLAVPSDRGMMIQDRVEEELSTLVNQGLLAHFERGRDSSDAVHFLAFMPTSQWTDGNRDTVLNMMLQLEHQLHIVIMLDLRKERGHGRTR